MPYYAHIRQDENGETIYQTVAEHLTGTAALCREFAADFGAEADGDLMGLAHDLGKCTDAFQKRLLEGGPVVDHTTAGMLTCIRMKRPSAAACVAGHHGGLLDVGNLRTDRAGEATLSGRFKKGIESVVSDKDALFLSGGRGFSRYGAVHGRRTWARRI